jgi:uncharacterized membrane protein YsdA (DUF1294 family)
MRPRVVEDDNISILNTILLAYFILNLLAFALYGLDKGRAIRGGRRIKEISLLLAALLGPFGAYLGMKIFRHKTKILKFKLVLIFLLLHAALIVFILIGAANLA